MQWLSQGSASAVVVAQSRLGTSRGSCRQWLGVAAVTQGDGSGVGDGGSGSGTAEERLCRRSGAGWAKPGLGY